MALLDMKRNDVAAALEYAVELYERGRFTADTEEVLLMLQDDPSELLAQLEALNEEKSDG